MRRMLVAMFQKEENNFLWNNSLYLQKQLANASLTNIYIPVIRYALFKFCLT